MPAPRCRALLGGLVAALMLTATPLMAQEPAPGSAPDQVEAPTKRAAALKEAGDKAMDSLHYADALEAYQAAYQLSPTPALLYNLGRVFQALNRHPEALAKVEAFKATAPADLLLKVPDLDKLLEDLRARVSTLDLGCNVAGARVLVDRTVVGTIPLSGQLKLNAGVREVDVQAEGYFPFHQTVDLKGAEVRRIQVTLLRSSNGILVVNASSPGADVAIDGLRVGIVPAEQVVTAGTHTLLLRHPQFADTTASIVVEAGQRREVTVPLRGKPVTTKWWFWASLGAAAATVAVVTAASLSTRPADTGTIPPGRISPQGVGGLSLRF
ncbi:TonB-dependent receptor [Minicystis rosea]|nr:TonB-dependent receptor [Minicystis rosea]